MRWPAGPSSNTDNRLKKREARLRDAEIAREALKTEIAECSGSAGCSREELAKEQKMLQAARADWEAQERVAVAAREEAGTQAAARAASRKLCASRRRQPTKPPTSTGNRPSSNWPSYARSSPNATG